MRNKIDKILKYLSIKNLIFSPNFQIKKLIVKNLKPLEIKLAIINMIISNLANPLLNVNNL